MEGGMLTLIRISFIHYMIYPFSLAFIHSFILLVVLTFVHSLFPSFFCSFLSFFLPFIQPFLLSFIPSSLYHSFTTSFIQMNSSTGFFPLLFCFFFFFHVIFADSRLYIDFGNIWDDCSRWLMFLPYFQYNFGDRLQSLLEASGAKVDSIDGLSSRSQVRDTILSLFLSLSLPPCLSICVLSLYIYMYVCMHVHGSVVFLLLFPTWNLSFFNSTCRRQLLKY